MSRDGRTPAVALLSAGAVAYEILLVRTFAIEQFHHFAYMAIGVAMLGFGASGTFLALVGAERATRTDGWFGPTALAAAATLLASPALANAIPLDASQLAWSAGEWIRLGALYLVLAIPFAAGALAVLIAIALTPERPGAVYGASFIGSGLGAVISVAVLWVLPPVSALAVPAVLACLGAALAVGAPRTRPAGAVLSWVLTAGAIAAVARPPWALVITPYKALPQTEAYPGARRVAERTSPVGWVVAVRAPAFRYAPGLSLGYRGAFPEQTGLFVDGDLAGAATPWDPESETGELLDWLPSAVPYALGGRRRVLIIGAAGGTEVWNALAHGAERVVAVELHPDLVHLAAANGVPASRESSGRVQWVVGDARTHIAHTPRRFDLISVGPGGAFGAGTAGIHSLNEDYLHTVEAYDGYLDRLASGGVLAVTRWLNTPPRQSVRVILTAAEALHRAVPHAASRGLVVLRSWGTVTVLAKPDGFAPHEIARVHRWATERQFDVDWQPGLSEPNTRFHFLEEPTLFRAAAAAIAGPATARRFVTDYPFDVRPATDARPYPHHFLRLSSLARFLSARRGDWLPFAEWGYLALVATLAQAVVLAGGLLLVPTVLGTRGAAPRGLLPVIAYFAALGLAYLAAEIAAIQQLGLLLGHPVYAVVAALAAFLVCSGLGSAWSDRHPRGGGRVTGVVLPLYLATLAVGSLLLVHVVQPAAFGVRAAVAILLLAPPAFLMGMPFPTGLRALAGVDRTRVAWAWAANGFASVVAAPLAAVVALEAGSPLVFALAAAAYASAGAIRRLGRPASSTPGLA